MNRSLTMVPANRVIQIAENAPFLEAPCDAPQPE